MKLAFVCVQNAGRSQMASAFAERERERRDLRDVTVLTGGTDPADHVHPNVADAMAEVGFDLHERSPRKITSEELADADVVVTMGCSADGICPATWRGDARDWGLDDPHGQDQERTHEIRDEIETLVVDLFDELFPDTTEQAGDAAADGDD